MIMGMEDLTINFYSKRQQIMLLDYKTKGMLFICDNII